MKVEKKLEMGRKELDRVRVISATAHDSAWLPVPLSHRIPCGSCDRSRRACTSS